MGIHQLHIEHVALLLLCTLLTVANSWIYKEIKGIHWFSLYNVSTLLGAAAVALRGVIPDFLSIVVGNLAVVLGYAFLFLSLTDLFGRSTTQIYIQAALMVAAAITMVDYGTLHPNTPYRLIAYSVVLGCQQIHVALLIARKEDGTLRFISAPMARVEMSVPDWDNLLMRCDQALYAVKRKGGNGHRVVPPTLRVATEAT